MRKLRVAETAALSLFTTRDNYCPGNLSSPEGKLLLGALASLSKLRLLEVEMTDDGASYSLNEAGRAKLVG